MLHGKMIFPIIGQTLVEGGIILVGHIILKTVQKEKAETKFEN